MESGRKYLLGVGVFRRIKLQKSCDARGKSADICMGSHDSKGKQDWKPGKTIYS